MNCSPTNCLTASISLTSYQKLD